MRHAFNLHRKFLSGSDEASLYAATFLNCMQQRVEKVFTNCTWMLTRKILIYQVCLAFQNMLLKPYDAPLSTNFKYFISLKGLYVKCLEDITKKLSKILVYWLFNISAWTLTRTISKNQVFLLQIVRKKEFKFNFKMYLFKYHCFFNFHILNHLHIVDNID